MRLPVTRKMRKTSGEIVEVDKTLEVNVKPGWKGGTTVTYPGEGDAIDGLPTDLVVVLQEKPHALFVRDGNNLLHRHKITLVEALVGVKFPLTLLDGRVLNVEVDLVTSRTVLPFPEDGFISSSTENKGDLFVDFDIVWPSQPLSPDDRLQIAQGPLARSMYKM